MKKLSFVISLVAFQLCGIDIAYNQTPNFDWVNTIGGSSNDGEDGCAITVDTDGNVIVVGRFQGPATIAGTSLSSNANSIDIFIAKFSASGSLLWVKTAGGSGEDFAKDVSVDQSNNIIITGFFNGTATFGPGETNQKTLSSSGSQDIFVAKYNSANGNLLNAEEAGGPGGDSGHGVATDSGNNILVTGSFQGHISQYNLNSEGSKDVFIVKYSPSLSVIWAKHAGGTGEDSGADIAIDGSDNVIVTGRITGTAYFGRPNANQETLNSNGGLDIFIAKYNSSGALSWAEKAGGPTDDRGLGIATDGDNIVVVGDINNEAVFGGNTTLNTEGGSRDAFVAKYNSSGSLSWAKNAGSSNGDRAWGVITDSSNDIFVTGRANGTMKFGSITKARIGGKDIFVAKYDKSSGAAIWAKIAGGSNDDEGLSITSAPSSGDIFVAGIFEGTATFDGISKNSNGSFDIFIGRLATAVPNIPDIDVAPSPGDFGSVNVGNSSDKTFVVRNTGTATLNVSSTSTEGTHSSQFVIVSGGGSFNLSPNGTRNVVVRFTPASPSNKSATLRFISNDPDENQKDVQLSGIGVQVTEPDIDVAPSPGDFGSISVGSSSDKTFVVRNLGTANLSVDSSRTLGTHSSQFSIFSGGGAFTLSPNGTRNVVVRFSPTSQSDKSAILRFVSNDPDENPKDVPLSGKGVSGILLSDPTALDFDSVSVGGQLNKTLVLRNTGDASINVNATTIGGTDSDQFSIEAGDGPFELSSNSSRSLTIGFKPTSAGVKTALLNISHDGSGSPFTVSLAAFGLDSKPPEFGLDNFDSETDLGTPVAVSITVTDNESVQEVSLYYREGGMSPFESVSMTNSGDIYSGTIPSEVVGSRGIEFYIEAVDGENNESTTVIKAIRVRLPGNQLTKNHLGGLAQTAYRLISFPLELDNPSASSALLGDLGSVDTLQWRLWDINPSDRNAQDPYREYPAISNVGPGKALFLITRESKTLTSGSGETVDTVTPFTIPLATGWNMFASPFNFDIPLTRIEPASLRDGIIIYEGSWNTPTALKPWSGYMIKVSTPSTLTINAAQSATIPPSIVTKSSTVPDWFIEIVGRAELAFDDGNIAGVIHDAELEWDRYERFEPPPIGEYVMVSFPHWDWRPNPDVHRTDFRPSDVDGHVWEFSVYTNIREKLVHLNFENLVSVPVDFEIELVDIGLKISQDLRNNNQYTYRSTKKGKKQFQLVVGKFSFVEDSAQFTGVPTTFELDQNFPNPFNPSTTIRYGLPQSGRVTLTIYNLLGEKIAVLFNAEYQAEGYHSVLWDGRNESGKYVGSGMYIYQMRVGTFSVTRKMAFIK